MKPLYGLKSTILIQFNGVNLFATLARISPIIPP